MDSQDGYYWLITALAVQSNRPAYLLFRMPIITTHTPGQHMYPRARQWVQAGGAGESLSQCQVIQK